MAKLIIVRGSPELPKINVIRGILEKGDTVYIGRTYLQTMLSFDGLIEVDERVIYQSEISIAYELLSEGINVIIDDDNIEKWNEVAEQMYSELEVINIEEQ